MAAIEWCKNGAEDDEEDHSESDNDGPEVVEPMYVSYDRASTSANKTWSFKRGKTETFKELTAVSAARNTKLYIL